LGLFGGGQRPPPSGSPRSPKSWFACHRCAVAPGDPRSDPRRDTSPGRFQAEALTIPQGGSNLESRFRLAAVRGAHADPPRRLDHSVSFAWAYVGNSPVRAARDHTFVSRCDPSLLSARLASGIPTLRSAPRRPASALAPRSSPPDCPCGLSAGSVRLIPFLPSR
jgi:hypothetical protein